MSLHHLVHCHVCPLKDFCTSGKPDASWRVQHQGQTFRKGTDSVFVVQLYENDYESMNKATANCLLRRAVAYTETMQVKEFLRQST